MACRICDIIAGKIPGRKVFQDEKVVAFIDLESSSLGHLRIVPIKHFTIFEQISDDIVSHLFKIANKLSISIIESTGVQGINLMVNNGISAGQVDNHFIINLIPRRESDGINFIWSPKQMSEQELSTIEIKVKESVQSVSSPEIVAGSDKNSPDAIGEGITETIDEDSDYLVRCLDRLP